MNKLQKESEETFGDLIPIGIDGPYQKLFDYFVDEHELMLTISEMDEVIKVSQEVVKNINKEVVKNINKEVVKNINKEVVKNINKKTYNPFPLNINTILHTKDSEKSGNAIVTGRSGYHWEITTDYGNKAILTSEEIDKRFKIGWSNWTKENNDYTCEEMQAMVSSDHKYRVEKIIIQPLSQPFDL